MFSFLTFLSFIHIMPYQYRAGTRFGPQGIRRISALYTPYNYEKGIDLREQMVNHNSKSTIDALNHQLIN